MQWQSRRGGYHEGGSKSWARLQCFSGPRAVSTEAAIMDGLGPTSSHTRDRSMSPKQVELGTISRLVYILNAFNAHSQHVSYFSTITITSSGPGITFSPMPIITPSLTLQRSQICSLKIIIVFQSHIPRPRYHRQCHVRLACGMREVGGIRCDKQEARTANPSRYVSKSSQS